MDPKERVKLCTQLIEQHKNIYKSVDNLHNNPPTGYSYWMYSSFMSSIEKSSVELSKTISNVCGSHNIDNKI